MKKIPFAIMLCVLLLVFTGCSNAAQNEDKNTDRDAWDVSLTCAAESFENEYVITYSETKIISKTGTFTVENKNDFPIKVHISAGKGEQSLDVEPGKAAYFSDIATDEKYGVGIHADVEEGTMIDVMIYDGTRSDIG